MSMLRIIEATSTSIWVLDMIASFLRGFLDTNTGADLWEFNGQANV